VCVAATCLVLLVGRANDAAAHQTSVSRSIVTLSPDRTKLTYEITFDTKDLHEELKRWAGGDASLAKITPENVFALLTDRIRVTTNRDCTATLESHKNLDAREAIAKMVWEIDCGAKILDLTIDYRLFYDIDDAHTSVLSPREGNHRLDPYLFKRGGAPYHWNDTNWLLFIRFGMEHIAYGIDHVFFLLGLLFVVLLGRRQSGELYLRHLRECARYTGLVVSSFTIAHSCTLIAAALGWFTLPSRFVESMIAVSIVYVAVENIIYPYTHWRPVITFCFGLLHGMGFASALSGLLPPHQIVFPLLLFNVGVELGQLCIVLAVLPLFALAAYKVGPERYRSYVIPAGSVAVGLFGLIWFVERAFGL